MRVKLPMTRLPALADLGRLSHAEMDALIVALSTRLNEALARVDAVTARIAELETKLGEPPRTPDNSSTPPSRGHKPNKAVQRKGRRRSAGTAAAPRSRPDRRDQHDGHP